MDLTRKDSRGFTPLQTALGQAGGFGFGGRAGVVREETAGVIAELTGVPLSDARASIHLGEFGDGDAVASVRCDGDLAVLGRRDPEQARNGDTYETRTQRGRTTKAREQLGYAATPQFMLLDASGKRCTSASEWSLSRR